MAIQVMMQTRRVGMAGLVWTRLAGAVVGGVVKRLCQSTLGIMALNLNVPIHPPRVNLAMVLSEFPFCRWGHRTLDIVQAARPIIALLGLPRQCQTLTFNQAGITSTTGTRQSRGIRPTPTPTHCEQGGVAF